MPPWRRVRPLKCSARHAYAPPPLALYGTATILILWRDWPSA
jgi:hypothetical protein